MALQHRPGAVVFDWDNTLIDSWAAIHAALTAAFEAMEMAPWTMEECKARVRASARDAFPKLFGARAAEAAGVFYSTFQRDHLTRLEPLPGALELIEALDAAGIYLAVVSNKRGDMLRAEAEHLGWAPRFAALVGANDAAQDKPSAEPVQMALAGFGGTQDSVWFVGDTDIDIDCAYAAGCYPVLLRTEAPGEGEFGERPPALHLQNCRDLKALLID